MAKYSAPLLLAGADLNTLFYETRKYDVTGAVNGPAAGNYVVDVELSPRSTPGDIEVTQTATNKATGVKSFRAFDGGVWSSWTTAGSGGGGGTLYSYVAEYLYSVSAAGFTILSEGSHLDTSYQAAWPASGDDPAGKTAGGVLLAPVAGIYAVSMAFLDPLPADATASVAFGDVYAGAPQHSGTSDSPLTVIGYAAAGAQFSLQVTATATPITDALVLVHAHLLNTGTLFA
ncbi:MAG: pyocin knob domain-containing protein [Hyphomicrobiaceae bacterium]